MPVDHFEVRFCSQHLAPISCETPVLHMRALRAPEKVEEVMRSRRRHEMCNQLDITGTGKKSRRAMRTAFEKVNNFSVSYVH